MNMKNKNTESYLENIVNGNFEWVLSALTEDVSLLAVLDDCVCMLLSDYPSEMKQYIVKLHDFALQAVEKWHRREVKRAVEDVHAQWDADRENLIQMYDFG